MENLATRGAIAAERFLERRGFDIVDRPYEDAGGAEPVGIVAKDGETLVFAAVECRAGGESFPGGKPDRVKLEEFACRWLAEHSGRVADVRVRFDVISIVVLSPDRAFLKHWANALGACETSEEG